MLSDLEVKFLEVRDEGTHIPVMCTRITARSENYQLWRAGFAVNHTYYILVNLPKMECQYDWANWVGRTLKEAHFYIAHNWDALVNHQVIDVEFILGETKVCKLSERTYVPSESGASYSEPS